MSYTLHHGDHLQVLRAMPDCSVDSIVTDVQYGLTNNSGGPHGKGLGTPFARAQAGATSRGFMGMEWDGDSPKTEVYAECLRVLKPGGHLLTFTGTRTYHRIATRIEDAGFEIRDMIAWVYGSGFPKSRNIAKQDMEGVDAVEWDGFGTSLKPALEPIVVARKAPIGTIAANVLAFGTGALNIDACRVPYADADDEDEYRDKCASVVGLDSNRNGNAYGEWSGQREDSASPIGRFPANFIHDGSAEVLALFPDSDGAGGSVPNVKVTGYGGGIGTGESAYLGGERLTIDSGTGSAARFFYCAKASRLDRNFGLADPGPQFKKGSTLRHAEVLNANGERKGNHHPTVKPIALGRYLSRLITPPGGTMLDICAGSGSLMVGGILEGFDVIGIELDQDGEGNSLGYIDLIRQRCDYAVAEYARMTAQKNLFGEVA